MIIHKIAIALLAFSTSAHAATIVCDSIEKAQNVPDSECENIEASAEKCFTDLYKGFHNLEKAIRQNQLSNAADRTRAIEDLTRDYKREIANLTQKYIPALRARGDDGSGRMCLDQKGAVEEYRDGLREDLHRLENPKWPDDPHDAKADLDTD